MCCPEDHVEMDNTHNRLTIVRMFWLDSIHACGITRHVSCTGEPMHQSGWIFHPIKGERKEQACSGNL